MLGLGLLNHLQVCWCKSYSTCVRKFWGINIAGVRCPWRCPWVRTGCNPLRGAVFDIYSVETVVLVIHLPNYKSGQLLRGPLNVRWLALRTPLNRITLNSITNSVSVPVCPHSHAHERHGTHFDKGHKLWGTPGGSVTEVVVSRHICIPPISIKYDNVVWKRWCETQRTLLPGEAEFGR